MKYKYSMYLFCLDTFYATSLGNLSETLKKRNKNIKQQTLLIKSQSDHKTINTEVLKMSHTQFLGLKQAIKIMLKDQSLIKSLHKVKHFDRVSETLISLIYKYFKLIKIKSKIRKRWHPYSILRSI